MTSLPEEDPLQCENCKKELPADDWVFVRGSGPTARRVDKLASILKQYQAVFCSDKCMYENQALDYDKQRSK
jgi:hypothetical protein